MTRQATKKPGRPAGKAATTKPSAKPAAKPSVKPAVTRKSASAPASNRVSAKAPADKSAAKPAVKPAAKPATKPATKPSGSAPKADKPKKQKLVRDSFTMPEAEYATIAAVKKACLTAGLEIKKSEILRIGVALIAKLTPARVKRAQAALLPLKAGRPKKHK